MMVKSKQDELDEEPVSMVDVVALVLVTRADNGEPVGIGEEFELPEESLLPLEERGIVCLASDYIPPLEEGEELEVEIEVTVEVEMEEEIVEEEFDDEPYPEDDELIIFESNEGDN